MHDRTDWTRGRSGPLTIKGRAYNNLVEFTRPCQTCKKPFAIYVTSKIAMGHADSNSFGLKNCEEHRKSALKGDSANADQLRMANNVMKQELDGLYARDQEHMAEIQRLKARLATFELQGAMQAAGEQPANNLTFPWRTA